MSVIVGEALARTYILRPRALERVRRDNRAGDLFLSVDAVGVAGNRINAFAPFERNRQRQQKFDVASPATVTANGHSGFAARQQHARRRNRLSMRYDMLGDPRHHLADVARFAFDAVAQNQRCDARRARDRRRGFERHLRCRNDRKLRARETRVAGFDRFARTGFEHAHRGGRRVDRVAPNNVERVRARGRIGDCRP